MDVTTGFKSQLKIDGMIVGEGQIVGLLKELDLMPLFIKRFIERKQSRVYNPSRIDQISHLQDFLSSKQISNEEGLKNWLALNKITEQDMSRRLFQSLQLKEFKTEKFSSAIDEIFLKRKSDLDKVLYSFLRVKSKEKALELYTRLNEGEDTFADLASEFAEGNEREVNGLLGPMPMGRINVTLRERLLVSKEGQLWPPFSHGDWWVLLRLEKRSPAKLDERTRQSLVDELYEEWIAQQVCIALSELPESLGQNDNNLVFTSIDDDKDANGLESDSKSHTLAFAKGVIQSLFKGEK